MKRALLVIIALMAVSLLPRPRGHHPLRYADGECAT